MDAKVLYDSDISVLKYLITQKHYQTNKQTCDIMLNLLCHKDIYVKV